MIADLSTPECPDTLAIALGDDLVAVYQADPMDGFNRLILCREQLMQLCLSVGIVIEAILGG